MEDWATVDLVLGSNGIMGAVDWLVTKRQIKHSEDQFEKQMQAKREVDKHNRRWEVRSEPLMKLRDELACMAEKFEGLVDFATQVIEGVSIKKEKIIKKREEGVIEHLEKAAKEWEEYFYNGKFHQALHMQYDYSLKFEAHEIFFDYQSAYTGLYPFLSSRKADEKVGEAKDVIRKNNVRISEVQSKIDELLEEL